MAAIRIEGVSVAFCFIGGGCAHAVGLRRFGEVCLFGDCWRLGDDVRCGLVALAQIAGDDGIRAGDDGRRAESGVA